MASTLSASNSRANTTGIHLHQLALRCRSGSRIQAYLELQSDATGATFDPSVGWTLLDSHGVMLSEVKNVFMSQSNSSWPKGHDWLIATGSFRSVTGVPPDGALTVLPDTLGGSVILFRLESDGVTRTTLDRLDYGLAAGLPVPLGAVLTRQADLTWALDWNPRPANQFTNVADVGTCFGDSLPMPYFHRYTLRCADGSQDGEFLELTTPGRPMTFDAAIQLSLLDHAGHSLATMTRPFGSRTGQTWGATRSFLFGTEGASSRLGLTPDTVWPVVPDPVGGSIVFSAVAGPAQLTQSLRYGAAGNAPVPGAGRGMVSHVPGQYLAELTVKTANFAGDTLDAPGCFVSFAADSCPLCTPPVGPSVCPPIYAPYNESGDQDWLALTSDSRVFTQYSQEPVRPLFQFTTDFDLSRGYLHSHAITYNYPFSPRPAPPDSAARSSRARPTSREDAPPDRLGAILAEDEFMIVGPVPGTAIDFLAGSTLTSHLGSETGQRAYAQTAAPFIDDLEVATIPVVVADTVLSQVVTLPLHAVVGTPFSLRYGFHAAAGATVDSRDSLYFSGIPAGYTIASCHGFSQIGMSVVASLVEDARADASPGHASVRWIVLQPPGSRIMVQRRADDAAWLDVTSVSPDGDGTIDFEDAEVLANHQYGYRLAWTDPRRGPLTGGEVWVSIPSTFRFALREASPNPARGNILSSFQLGEPARVQIEVLDVAGRRVRSDDLGLLPAGDHALTVARDGALSPGIYLVRLRAGARVAQTRVVLLR